MGNKGIKLKRFSEEEKKIFRDFVSRHEQEGKKVNYSEVKDLVLLLAEVNGGIHRTPGGVWSGLKRFGRIALAPEDNLTNKTFLSARSNGQTLQKILECLAKSHAKVDKAIRRLIATERKAALEEKKELQAEVRRLKELIREKDTVLRRHAKLRAAVEEIQASEGVPLKKRISI